jgi:hypothetical protein
VVLYIFLANRCVVVEREEGGWVSTFRDERF